MEANQIFVREVRVDKDDNHTIRYEVEYGTAARPYFSEESFFVSYDRDMSAVPKGLLVIPLLANLCPVAWVAGADVHVDELDRKFYGSLVEVKASLTQLYPRLSFSGEIHAQRLTSDVPAVEPVHTAAFFSGGVDSLATFIRQEADAPYLITVWGADIGFDKPEMWQQVKQDIETFGQSKGVRNLFIKSNLHGFLNEELISFNFGRFTKGWWPGVQHGIGMVGLCAPLAHVLGIHRLYVPSALPPKLALSVPDGSNTSINNKIRWEGTEVKLEGEELTRQDKVGLIAAYIRRREPDLKIRVCWSNREYGNCGRCEKCLRTLTALLSEGIDPVRAGFPLSEDTLLLLRTELPRWLPGNTLRVEYWDEIRVRSLENRHLLAQQHEEFFDWFQAQNLQTFKKKLSMKKRMKDLIPHPLFLYIKRKTI